jgi:hypothetical protein
VWLSLVSSARRAGDFRVLYPKGVKRIDQVPWPLQEAINHALGVLSWFENYVSEEIPPENLWDDGEFVEEHFKRIRQQKEDEREGWGGSKKEADEESDLMSNDMASVFKA